MGAHWYWLVILVVYLGAFRDWMNIPWKLRRALLRCAAPWLLAWLSFQAAAGVFFIGAGDLQRAGTPLLWYIANSMMLFLLVPAGTMWSASAKVPVWPLLRRIAYRKTLFQVKKLLLFSGLAVVPVLVTAVLLHWIPWHVDESFVRAVRPKEGGTASNAFFAVYMLLSAAVAEELILRHYLLSRMVAAASVSRRSVAAVAAVVFTAAVFAMGHGAMISPEWIKYTQTFLYGCALGAAQLKLGSESAILLHLFYNAASVGLAAS